MRKKDMIKDKTPRWHKSLDALSQWINVTFLPDNEDTTSNESVSGRSYRMKWKSQKIIDAFFFWEQNPGHCERAYLADITRAKQVVEYQRT